MSFVIVCTKDTFDILIIKIRNNSNYMSAIIILLFASISIAIVFLVAFIWSVKSGQFDDEASPPMRILFEESDLPNSPIK